MKKALDILSSVAVIVLCIVGVYNFYKKPTGGGRPPAPEPPKELVSLADAEVQGNPDAKVALIVFSDFECPYCGKFANEILPAVEEKYVKTGKVVLAFRNFPLEQIHKQALPAAEYAYCAAEQGKFWAAHDGLFADQSLLKGDWQPGFVQKYGLSSGQFNECIASPKTEARVKADAAIAKKYNLTGTPAILIGANTPDGVRVSKVFPGVGSVEELSTAIDGLLGK